MENILSDHLPQLIQSLCHQFRQGEGEARSAENVTLAVQKIFRSSPPVYVPHAPINSGNDLHDECNLITRAGDFATEAIRLYTKQMVSTLRFRHNLITPIYRLPNEVLALIFQFAESSPYNSLQPLESRVPLNISAVSRVWREIALDTPQIWTTIDVMSAPFQSTLIERSRNAPLCIDFVPSLAYPPYDRAAEMLHPRQIAVISKAFEMWRKNFAHFIQSLLPHINRWGSLKLREIDIFQFEMLQILPAPRLETLHISDIGIGRELTNAPHILFGERTPRLRDLSLTGVAIPLTSPVYSGLTRLQLASIHFIESSLPRLVESLAACPHLESLSLDTVEFPPLTMFGTHFVVLERLDFLRLGRLDRAAERFIFTAILPCPSLRLEMNSSVHAQDCGIFPPEAPLGILDTLQRSHQRIHSLEIHAHPTALSIIGRNKMYGEALFTLYFPDCGTSCLAKILPNLSPYIPFSQLEALTLYGLDERKMSTEEFGDIVFRRFPIVKVLALVSCTPSFLDAITITPVSLLFPLLQTLRLVNMHVSGATVAVVESRMRQGHHFRPPGLFYPLQHVVLSNCYGEVRARIPELRELVDLDWS